MLTIARRTRTVPPEIVAKVCEIINCHGVNAAAHLLGISRATALSIAAGQPAMAGTLALLREALQRREAA
jgi:hypothetical protein